MTALRSLFPSTRPSLLLDFANGKRLDPRINFTRNSAATYFDRFGVLKTAAVDEPRFTHDPVTGESLGLMVEEQRTNLLLRSEEFDSASWVKVGSTVTANATTAPDGTMTADKLVESAATSEHFLYQSVSFTAGNTYTFYVYAEAAERSTIAMLLPSAAFSGGQRVVFDLVAGTSTANAGSPTHSIKAIPGGRYLCKMSAVAVNTASGNASVYLWVGGSSYTGDGTSGIYIWGAQLEAGSLPTSYIKTEASQVTRAADSSSILFGNNLLTRSEEFDNASWFKTRATVTANATTAPDGTTSADLFTGDETGNPYIFNGMTLTQSVSYCMSCFVKQNNPLTTSVSLRDFTEAGFATFNIVDGTVATTSGIASNAAIENVGNGWFRISAVFTPTIATGNHNLSPVNGVGTTDISLYIWGAQLEQASSPSYYTRTTTAAVTGKVWNDWFNPVEGSVCVNGSLGGGDTSLNMLAICDGSLSDRMIIAAGANNTVWNPFIIQNNSAQFSVNLGGTPQANSKVVMSYKADDTVAALDGSVSAVDISSIVPMVDRLFIGASASGVANTALIKKLSYYPVRLSDINLQSITRNNP